MEETTDLNDYHRRQSARLRKKRSAQSLMSSDEFTEQVRQLSNQSQRTRTNAGPSVN